MSYSIRIDEGRIEVAHEGHLTVAEIRQAQRDAAEWLAKHSMGKLLVDVRKADTRHLSFTDIFSVNDSYPSVFAPPIDLCLAFVVDAVQLETSMFAETVARNRGTACRVFLVYDEAVKWLTEMP